MERLPRLGAAILVALMVAWGAAPLSAQVRGVTPTEVILGTSAPLSGPAAAWGITAIAAKTYLDLINEAGGIHGRTIRLEIRDDAYLPPRAVANVRELAERVGVFAIVGIIGSANAFAVRDYAYQQELFWMTPAIDSHIWIGYPGNRYVYTVYPDYYEEARIFTRYAVETLGAQRLAVFYQNDQYGLAGLEGVQDEIARLGDRARLVAEVPYEVSDTDLAAHAQRLQSSGADAVIIYATPNHGAMIAQAMARIGYHPHRLATFTLGDATIMTALAGEAWEGVISAGYFPLPDEDPVVAAALERVAQREPSLRAMAYNALAGISFVEPFVEALRRAGPDLTRESFVEAIESLQDWDGEVIRKVTFGPDRHQGINRIYLTQIQNGRAVVISDWITYPVGF